MSSGPSAPSRIRLPTASGPRLNLRVNASLTIATFGRAERVGARELAPAHQRHAHRAEEARPDAVVGRRGVGVGRRLEAFHRDAVVPVVAGEHRDHREHRARHAGQRRDLCPRSPRTARACAACRSRSAPATPRTPPGDRSSARGSTLLTFSRLFANSPAGTSSAIDIAICTVASVARKRFAAFAPDGCPAWFLSVVASSGLVLCSAGNRPNSSPVVDRQQRPRTPASRGSSLKATSAAASGGMNEPIRSSVHFATSTPPTRAQHRQQHRLGEQLPHQLPAAGADRQPHGHLGGPAAAAHQQQVGDVGAGDQQHGAGDREQDQQRRARLAVDLL